MKKILTLALVVIGGAEVAHASDAGPRGFRGRKTASKEAANPGKLAGALAQLKNFLKPEAVVPAPFAPVTRHRAVEQKLAAATLRDLVKTLEVVEQSAEKKEALRELGGELDKKITEASVDGEYIIDLATRALSLVETAPEDVRAFYSGSPEKFSVREARLTFALHLQTLLPFIKRMHEPGGSFTAADLKTIREVGTQVEDLAQFIAAKDPILQEIDRVGLRKYAERIKDQLAFVQLRTQRIDGRMIVPEYQVAAKAAVYVIQGCLEIAAIMGIQQQRLALSNAPEHQSQRTWYRRVGLCTLTTALLLGGCIVVGNAVGVIDIQTVFTVKELLASLSTVLA